MLVLCPINALLQSRKKEHSTRLDKIDCKCHSLSEGLNVFWRTPNSTSSLFSNIAHLVLIPGLTFEYPTCIRCVCAYIHTYTYIHSHLRQKIEKIHTTPQGPKNSDGLYHGIYVFEYVYKVRMCIYMLRGRIWSWAHCFFFHIFFYPKKKSKRYGSNTKNSNALGLDMHWPTIKSTKLLFEVLIAIIIVCTYIHT